MESQLLTRIELTILAVLRDHPGQEVPERELRSLLRSRGFRRSAPAFVFTMQNLADKGLITCREERRSAAGVQMTDRYYSEVSE